MPKIALVYYHDKQYADEYDDYSSQKVIDCITEWTEISYEDLKILQMGIGYTPGLRIVEFLPDQQKIIHETVQSCLKRIKAEKTRQENLEKERKAKTEENKKKRDLAAYNRLKEKFGNKNV